MRILDKDKDQAVRNIVLLLTKVEANEFYQSIMDLLKNENQVRHQHVNDQEFKHEITVSLYDPTDLTTFKPRFQKLIQEDV
ncbi:hypothetical protein [Dehalogenimonas alkenigignens]|uniref:hypothetical protein n=1 Tax=Dehalogenimonas alkenigignens TaxID=1217799 RepID=UPI000D572302|nr:hypothetical protein [Dehalogenimonas alkenigignens]PVV83040.1 hypothetical protein DD509_07365 [Dehalogenimonas alkenigignens]